MKKIYIVLTYTGTVLSNIIKYYTKNEFSHVSIALDNKLYKMYSFGRLNPYNPFYGGFVHERINKGTFKRFSNTKAAVYSLEVEDEQYKIIEEKIKSMKRKRRIYKFNILGLFAVAINKRIKIKNHFYCAEFVKYILEHAKVYSNLPGIMKPEDFKELDRTRLKYKGLLRKYNPVMLEQSKYQVA